MVYCDTKPWNMELLNGPTKQQKKRLRQIILLLILQWTLHGMTHRLASIIQPHFDYASSAWYPNLGKGLKNKLQIAQNKCIRYCLYLRNREGIRHKHFKEINWQPITDRVDQFIAVSVYKFSKGLAPKYMDDVFKRNSSLHQRHTRYSDESKLSTPHRKHDYGKNCLSYGEQPFGIALK